MINTNEISFIYVGVADEENESKMRLELTKRIEGTRENGEFFKSLPGFLHPYSRVFVNQCKMK